MELLAHGGAVGLIGEAGAVVAIVALWGWVWWRSRGDVDEEALASRDEAAVEEGGRERE
jgi:hypothetical protein